MLLQVGTIAETLSGEGEPGFGAKAPRHSMPEKRNILLDCNCLLSREQEIYQKENYVIKTFMYTGN